MSEVKKVTKANRFSDIKAMLKGEEVAYGTTVEEAVTFIDRQMEILAAKNSSKSNSKKAQAAREQNETYIAYIMDELGKLEPDNPGMTCNELLRAIPALYNEGYSTQKVASLLRGPKEDGKVVCAKVKGSNRYKLP